jgi:isopenicillin-N epimerase
VVAAALPAVDAPVPATPAPCLRLVPLPDGVATSLESADELYRRLSALGVEVQVTPYDGRGHLRLSAAVYNEIADYERLAEVLPTAL